MCHLYPDFLTSYKIRKKVMEQLFKVSQPNVSLFVPVNCPPPWTGKRPVIVTRTCRDMFG